MVLCKGSPSHLQKKEHNYHDVCFHFHCYLHAYSFRGSSCASRVANVTRCGANGPLLIASHTLHGWKSWTSELNGAPAGLLPCATHCNEGIPSLKEHLDTLKRPNLCHVLLRKVSMPCLLCLSKYSILKIHRSAPSYHLSDVATLPPRPDPTTFSSRSTLTDVFIADVLVRHERRHTEHNEQRHMQATLCRPWCLQKLFQEQQGHVLAKKCKRYLATPLVPKGC